MPKHNNVPPFVSHSAINAEKSKREKAIALQAQEEFRRLKRLEQAATGRQDLIPPAIGADGWKQAYQKEEELLAASQERVAAQRRMSAANLRAAVEPPKVTPPVAPGVALADVYTKPREVPVTYRAVGRDYEPWMTKPDGTLYSVKEWWEEKITPAMLAGKDISGLESRQGKLRQYLRGQTATEMERSREFTIGPLRRAGEVAGGWLEERIESEEERKIAAQDFYESWMTKPDGTNWTVKEWSKEQIAPAAAAGGDIRELERKQDQLKRYIRAKGIAEVGLGQGIETASRLVMDILQKQEAATQKFIVPATGAVVYSAQNLPWTGDNEMERIADEYMAQGEGWLSSVTKASREVELPWGVQGALELILDPINALPVLGWPGLITKPALLAFGTLGKAALIRGATGGITRKFTRDMITKAIPDEMARLMPEGTPWDIPNLERTIDDLQGKIDFPLVPGEFPPPWDIRGVYKGPPVGMTNLERIAYQEAQETARLSGVELLPEGYPRIADQIVRKGIDPEKAVSDPRIAAEIARISKVVSTGKKALLARLDLEIRFGRINPDTGKLAIDWLEMLPDKFLDDLGSSYLKILEEVEPVLYATPRVMVGEYAPGSIIQGRRLPSIIRISKSMANNPVDGDRFIIHEVAHHLEEFVPSQDARKLVRQYQREMRSKGKRLVAEVDEIRRKAYVEKRALTSAEALKVRNAYRYTNFTEWFAEVLTDKALRDLYMEVPVYRDIIQKVIAQIRIMAVATRDFIARVLGRGDEAERVYKKLISGDYSVAERRALHPYTYDFEDVVTPSTAAPGRAAYDQARKLMVKEDPEAWKRMAEEDPEAWRRMVEEDPEGVIELAIEPLVKKWESVVPLGRNSVRAAKDLDGLKAKGFDTDSAESALKDYKDTVRGDFDDVDDFTEARTEAWDNFVEALNDIEPPYFPEEATTAAPVTPAPAAAARAAPDVPPTTAAPVTPAARVAEEAVGQRAQGSQRLEKPVKALRAYVKGMKDGVASVGEGPEARRVTGAKEMAPDLRSMQKQLEQLETKRAENALAQFVSFTAAKTKVAPILGFSGFEKTVLSYKILQRQAKDFAELTLASLTGGHLKRTSVGLSARAKRALRPGDPIFPVNKEGIWIGTRQPGEGAERLRTWTSVLEDKKAVLSPNERALRDEYVEVFKQTEAMRVRNGLAPRTVKRQGKYYIPHISLSKYGAGYVRKVAPGEKRIHALVSEGMVHGTDYSLDPMFTLKAHMQEAYQEVIDTQFDEIIRKYEVSIDLIDANVSPKTKTRYRAAEKALADAKKTGEAGAIAKATKEFEAAEKALHSARQKLATYQPKNTFNEMERIPFKAWNKAFYAEKDLKYMKEALGFGPRSIVVSSPDAHKVAKGMAHLVNHIRFLSSVGDFAMPFLQGLPLLVTHPGLWSSMTAKHYQAFFDPTVQARYFLENLDVFQDMVRHGIPVGDVELFTALREGQGISILGDIVEKQFGGAFKYAAEKNIPMAEKVTGRGMRETFRGIGKQSFGRFQAAYDMGLASARAELWKSLSKREVWKESKNELAQYIRNMTGGLDAMALGVGPNQQMIEGMWLAFSPRYLRSTLALMTDAIRGLGPGAGIAQRESAKTMASLVFALGGFFALANIGIGWRKNESWEEIWERIRTSWNPLEGKKFLALNINGEWIGVGGQVRSMLQLTAKLATAVIYPGEEGRNRFEVFLRADPMENPLLAAWHARAAPGLGVAGAVGEMLGADILPFDNIDTMPDLLAHVGTSALPFAVQAKIEGDSWMSTTIGGLGLRTKTETIYDKRERMVGKLFNDPGLKWGDLFVEQKKEFREKYPRFEGELKQETIRRCGQGDTEACDREAIDKFRATALNAQRFDDDKLRTYLGQNTPPSVRIEALQEWKANRKKRRTQLQQDVEEKRRGVDYPDGPDALMDEYYGRINKAKDEHNGILDEYAWSEVDQWVSERTPDEQDHISRNSGAGQRTELEQEYYRMLKAIEAYWEVGETEAVLSRFATVIDRAIAKRYAEGSSLEKEMLLVDRNRHTRLVAKRAKKLAATARTRLRMEGIPGQHAALLDALLGRWYGNTPRLRPRQIEQALDQWLGGGGVRAVTSPLRGAVASAAPRRGISREFLDTMKTKYGWQG